MDKEQAYNILHDLHCLFNSNEIQHWLFFGTLLGAYRNNDFLSEDIDIVCDYKDYWKVRKIIETDLSWEYNCVWTKEIALFKYGRKIDILFADIEEENTYLYIYKPNKVTGKYHTEQRYVWKTKDIFPLQHMTVLKDLFLVPNNIPNCLTPYYGQSWNIPDPQWNRDRNPPLNLDTNYRQIAIYLQNENHREYFEKNYDKDWIKIIPSNNIIQIVEPFVLIYTSKFSFDYVYNLQVFIDLFNEMPDISNVTIGELYQPQKSISSRSLLNGYPYNIFNTNTKPYEFGEFTLFKNPFGGYLQLKTNINCLLRKKIK